MSRTLYLDHNASTPIDPEVFQEMLPWLRGEGANPSSAHGPGRRARHAIDRARERVAKALGAAEEEVVFVSSGTEANNLAILGALRARPGGRLLVSKAEHSSVVGPAKRLEEEGFAVDWLPVDSDCRADSEALLAAIRPENALVSLMLANNEVGTIQSVEEIARRLPKGALLHVDAVQAVGKIPVDFRKLGADCLSISAHKLYGPPGAGALLVRKGAPLVPLLFGGDQEAKRRGGTEDVPAIVGLGAAVERAVARVPEYSEKFGALARRFRAALAAEIPDARCNTPETGALPNTANFSFSGIDGRSLLIQLDLEGIAVSMGSACASGSLLPSHVLLAMGRTREEALSAIRFSLGWGIEERDVDFSVDALKKILARAHGSGGKRPSRAKERQKTQEGG